MKTKIFSFVCLLLVFVCQRDLQARTAIASAHPLATAAGFEIVRQGGNVFDAAVAVTAALAVVEPAGSGLGGGGFWLLHDVAKNKTVMLDGREKAPLAAHQNMYLDPTGKVNDKASKDGALAAAIPGLPAALAHLAEHYGRLPLKISLQPAIRLAQQGFKTGPRHQKLLRFRLQALQKNPAAAAVLLDQGEIPAIGSILRQADLAKTLSLLAEHGKAGFYQGAVAEQLLSAVRQAGGIWQRADLEQYQVIERQPMVGQYHGIQITSAALPSSGGIVMLEALNILSAYPLDKLNPVTRMHVVVEAMRRAYHDRARYLGDQDFVEVPVSRLLSPEYAAGIRQSIRLDRALPSDYLAATGLEEKAGLHTTHFSIIDEQGNRVAATLSINFPFGAAFMADGTGVLLNDEMDDFVSQAGHQNGYGLIGGSANAIEPGKRMLSSMTPTFLDDGRRIAVLGTPGGSRIISMVLLAVLDFAQGHGPESWVNVSRYHHQYIPDRIQYEKGGLTDDEISKLQALGHRLQEKSYRYGNMQAVQLERESRQLSAASDPRGEGLARIRSLR